MTYGQISRQMSIFCTVLEVITEKQYEKSYWYG